MSIKEYIINYTGAARPAIAKKGTMYFDTNDGTYYIYNGTDWITLANIMYEKTTIYTQLFDELCQENLDRKIEFESLLKLYKNNYRQTCHVIESILLEDKKNESEISFRS